MLSLQPHHIIDLYVWVDDLVKQKPRGPGRPVILSDSEVLTALVWNVLAMQQCTLKQVYEWMRLEHSNDFPRRPGYAGFVAHCHRLLPVFVHLLSHLLSDHAPFRFVDSTMLPVCALVRADHHKTCKNIAKFGKNHQGWHFGFKLHASVNPKGQLCGLVLTPANIHDAQMLPWITNAHTKVAVGDTAYNARVMREHLWERRGTFVLAPPHPKQKTKLLAPWQHLLLKARPKIESVFDVLKQHLRLVSSFPRSVNGYLLHYLRILLGYQIQALTLVSGGIF